MSTLKRFAAITLALSLLGPSLALAAEPARSRCAFEGYEVRSVAPYREPERLGKGTIERLRGAEIQVQAQPGLTAEWLQLSVQRHLEAMRSVDMKDCALDAGVARVSVRSAGTGFTLRLVANDTRSAEEVLRLARRLTGV
jgi:hypothetical protein